MLPIYYARNQTRCTILDGKDVNGDEHDIPTRGVQRTTRVLKSLEAERALEKEPIDNNGNDF